MGLDDRVRWWDDEPKYYGQPHDLTPRNRRIKAAIYGIQRCLRGQDALCYLTGVYDEPTRQAVAFFQGSKSQGRLRETGLFDKATAKELFSRYTSWFEITHDLPGRYLRGYATNEGVWDTGAQGPNLYDTGLMQINLDPDGGGFHDVVTQMQACNPLFSIPWACTRLVDRYRDLGDWRAAIVGHRSPLWALCMVGRKPWPTGYFNEKKQQTHEEAANEYVDGIINAGKL